MSSNYSVISTTSRMSTISVQLAVLMDLYNNNEGRYLGKSNIDADEAFLFALNNGGLITSLDQVAEKYGFDSSLIYKEDFMNSGDWVFVKREEK